MNRTMDYINSMIEILQNVATLEDWNDDMKMYLMLGQVEEAQEKNGDAKVKLVHLHRQCDQLLKMLNAEYKRNG